LSPKPIEITKYTESIHEGGKYYFSNSLKSDKLKDIANGYDNAYYVNVTDKVFLLDVKQMYDLYMEFSNEIMSYHNGISFRDAELYKEYLAGKVSFLLLEDPFAARFFHGVPTKKARESAQGYTLMLQLSLTHDYWLRTVTTFASPILILQRYDLNGNQLDYMPMSGSEKSGIRPALYIKQSDLKISKGYGTKLNPYYIGEKDESYVGHLVEGASEWARPILDKARAAGLYQAKLDIPFKENIKRIDFATLIVNMTELITGKEITPAPATTFTDTNNTSVLKAYSANIISGTGANTFAPNDLITREQIATMMYKAILYIESEKNAEYISKNDEIVNYTDSADVSSWAKAGIGVLLNNKIMEGTSKTTLSPKENATIEQCIVLVYKLYDALSSKIKAANQSACTDIHMDETHYNTIDTIDEEGYFYIIDDTESHFVIDDIDHHSVIDNTDGSFVIYENLSDEELDILIENFKLNKGIPKN